MVVYVQWPTPVGNVPLCLAQVGQMSHWCSVLGKSLQPIVYSSKKPLSIDQHVCWEKVDDDDDNDEDDDDDDNDDDNDDNIALRCTGMKRTKEHALLPALESES